MEALAPVSSNNQQVVTGWPTAPAQATQPTMLDEPSAPAISAPVVIPPVEQLAPEPPTIVVVPDVVVPAPVLPTPEPAGGQANISIPALPALSNEERWRAQQAERTIFPVLQRYTTSGTELWWFDPVNQQHVRLGSFSGEFEVQATFMLATKGVSALEVPYEVNRRYGLTALSPALLARIEAAGFGMWIETYILTDQNVRPI